MGAILAEERDRRPRRKMLGFDADGDSVSAYAGLSAYAASVRVEALFRR